MSSRTLSHLGACFLACVASVWSISCRSAGPILPGPEGGNTRGTVSGTVSGSAGSFPVARRLVEVVDVKTGKRFSTKTNVAGSYSLLVPPGTYRIEVALGRGEVIVRQPPPVEVKPADLVTGVDVIFGGAGVVQPPDSP